MVHQSQFIEDYYNRFEPTQLGPHISVIRGVSYKPTDIKDSAECGVAILRSNNISDGELNYENLVFVSEACVSQKQYLRHGDIVMCGSNGSKKLVGKAGLVTESGKTSFGAFCLGIRCNDSLCPEYLNAYFNSDMYRSIIEELGNGTNIINIKPDHITSLSIPIPQIEEQKRLVSMSHQVDKSKFDGFKSQFIEMFGDTFTNDGGWSFKKLPEVTTIVLGSTPSSSNPGYWDGDIKWITPAEIEDDSFYLHDSARHITKEGVQAASLKSFPAGTVILSTRAPIGKTAIAGCEMYCNQGFKNFVCSKAINPVYLYYTLKSHKDNLQSMGTGSTFLELSKKTIEQISVSVPPKSTQDEFERFFLHADKSKYLN